MSGSTAVCLKLIGFLLHLTILHNIPINYALALNILKASHFSNTNANEVDEASFIILKTSVGV